MCGNKIEYSIKELQYLDWNELQVCSENCIQKWILTGVGIDVSRDSRFIKIKRDGHELNSFKSNFELFVKNWLGSKNIKSEYETYAFDIFEEGIRKGSYTPDFFLREYGSFLEVKGMLSTGNRLKLKRFRKNYPDIRLLLIPWTLRKYFYRKELSYEVYPFNS